MRTTALREQPKLHTHLLREGDRRQKDTFQQVKDWLGKAAVIQTERGADVAIQYNEKTGQLEILGEKGWQTVGGQATVSSAAASPANDITGQNSRLITLPLTLGSTLRVTGGITGDTLTASRLVSSSASKVLVSSDLYAWVAGTANRVTVTDDTDGTITLSGPQDIHTGASPSFVGLTITGTTGFFFVLANPGVYSIGAGASLQLYGNVGGTKGHQFGRTVTLTRLRAWGLAAGAATLTVTVEKAGASTGLQVVVNADAGGWFDGEDIETVVFAASDLFTINLVTADNAWTGVGVVVDAHTLIA